LCAPKGSGFLYARRERQELVEPLVVSWGWNRDIQTSEVSRFVDEQEWQGTRDVAAFLAVPAAIEFQSEHDWPHVRAECHVLLREARRRIEESVQGASHLQPLCPDSAEWYAQMAALPLPPCDAEELQRRLYGEYRIEVPVLTWHDQPFVRVSIQGYNTAEDVEALVHALEVLLPQAS
jgi:isopenicillin-N epimerase